MAEEDWKEERSILFFPERMVLVRELENHRERTYPVAGPAWVSEAFEGFFDRVETA
jgi:hypothetical protein